MPYIAATVTAIYYYYYINIKPQGSVLGPLIFYILMNDLCDTITQNVFFLLMTLKSIEQLFHLLIVYFPSQL
jgi:hypothetical protein